jgi:hypothetical protein
MEGLTLIWPGFERICRIRDDLLKGNESAGIYTHLISGLLNWGRILFMLKRDFLGKRLKRSLRNSW